MSSLFFFRPAFLLRDYTGTGDVDLFFGRIGTYCRPSPIESTPSSWLRSLSVINEVLSIVAGTERHNKATLHKRRSRCGSTERTMAVGII